jgi:hypothetical protein
VGTSIRRVFLVLLAVALAGPALFAGRQDGFQAQGGITQFPAQTPPPASGRGPAPPQVGTGLILGQVIEASTGEPIADAVVSPGRGAGPPPVSMPGGAPAVNVFQSVVTGADGRFVFRNLPPGSYPVRASLTGYVPGMVGQGRPGGPDRALDLADGERIGDAIIRLWRYGVITGTVLDEAGEPAIDLPVRAYRRLTVDGRPQLMPATAQLARTDDRGRYRFARLTPGDYVVVVPLTQTTLPGATYDALIQAVITDPVKPPEWAFDLMLSGGIQGLQGSPSRVGDAMWSASFAGTPPPSATGPSSSYRTTYYPSANSPGLASLITVRPGEERTAIDMQLTLVPTVRVSGVVRGPAGPMPNLGVRLSPANADLAADLEGTTAVTRADGTFTFINVPPGSYVIKVFRAAPSESMMRSFRGESPNAPPTPSPPSPAIPALFGEQAVNVGEADVTGVSITMRDGLKVSGRVEFELRTPAAAGPTGPANSVSLIPLYNAAFAAGLMSTDPAMLDADGRFATSGQASGRYTMSLGRGGGGPGIKSITASGRDVTNTPLELKDTDITDVVIKVSDRLASLSGVVRGPNALASPTATVIAFPADYRALVANGLMAGRVRTVAASRAGAFAMGSVMPGDYLVVAVDDADVSDNQDTAFFDALAGGATRITFGDAEKKAQDLVLVKVKR